MLLSILTKKEKTITSLEDKCSRLQFDAVALKKVVSSLLKEKGMLFINFLLAI